MSGQGAGGNGSGSQGAGGRVVVTAADNGKTIALARGKVLVVTLGGQGQIAWVRPRLSQSGPGALRQLSSTGGYPSRASVVARFLAVRSGTATLTSVTDAPCLHATPKCAIPQRGWHVTIVVRG